MVADNESKGSSADKRSEIRIATKIEIEYKDSMDFVKSYMLNISKGGVFIHTDDASPLDTMVLLHIKLPGAPDIIETQGKVVWSNPKGGRGYLPRGMGIQFVKIRPADLETINKFVNEHRAQIESHSFI